MFKSWTAFWAATIIGLLVDFATGEPPTLKRFERSEMHMGVEFEVVLYASDEAKADEALTKAMARVAALDKCLSDFDPESELTRLSETSVVTDSQPGATFPAVK